VDGVPIDVSEARGAVQAAADRVAAVVRRVPDTGALAKGLTWTVGETAAHIVASLREHTAWVRGEGMVDYFVPDLAALNRRNIEQVSTRDPAALADLIAGEARAFWEETAGRAADQQLPCIGFDDLSLATVTCVLLGELVVHGLDIARTIGLPWPISSREAILSLLGAVTIMPMYLDPLAARGVEASYEVRLRGGPRFIARVRDGALTVGPEGSPRVDCRISANPVAFLLLGYGRVGQWGQIARGRLFAWGRKPWLALKFASLLRNP
jgi:uncharacterized protein (TIGR03083 family)